MIPLRRIFQDHQSAGSVNALVALWGFVDDTTFMTKGGAFGTVFRLHPRDAECLDHGERRAVAERFEQALRHLDESCRVYQYLIKRVMPPLPHDTHQNPVVDEALRHRAADLNMRRDALCEFDSYLVLLTERWSHEHTGWRRLHEGAKGIRNRLSSQRTVTALDGQLGECVAQLHHASNGFALHLADVLAPERLPKREAFRLFRRLLNYTPWKADQGSLKYDSHLDFFAADSSLECHRKCLQMDDVRIRVLTMKEPPTKTYAHSLQDLATVASPFIYCLEWQRRPVAAMRREIHGRRRHFFNKRVSLVNYLNSQHTPEEMLVDESASAVVHELGQSLTEMEVHGHVFGACSVSVVVHDTDPQRLEQSVAMCAKVFASQDGAVHDETYNLLNAWLAILPGNAAHNLRRLTLLNTTCADLSQLFTVDTGSRTSTHLAGRPYLAAFETAQGTPYFWNLHSGDVGHALVLGATGSGKSFLLNFILTHVQKYDPTTVIFDLGGGYTRLMQRLGGSTWRVGLTHRDFTINPFCLEPTPENLHFLFSFVRVLLHAGEQYRLTLQDDRDLYEAVQNIYALDPPQRRLMTLASLLPRALAQHLARWICGGPYADLFDNVDDTLTLQRVQCFDFEGLENYPAILEPLLFYVLHRASTSIRDADNAAQLKLFVLDEAWRFARDPTVQAYMTEALKTWRKRNAAMLLATQSSDDLAQSALLRTVVESCPNKFFLANAAIDIETARELFHLNDTEARTITRLQPRRQLLLKRPEGAKVLELRVDPESYWIYTNTPPDNDRLRTAIAAQGLDAGLRHLATTEGER